MNLKTFNIVIYFRISNFESENLLKIKHQIKTNFSFSKLNKMKIHLLIFISALLLSGSVHSQTIDSKATKETKSLFKNMKMLSKNHTMFAHQHATEYGHGWRGEEGRSDVKSVCGSHPAMIGVDFSGFSGRSDEAIKRTK